MKSKILSTLAVALFMLVASTGVTFAATSVRLQAPSNPTNQKNLNLTFVAQTTSSSDVNVQCYMQGPADGGYVAKGGAFTLTNPGNTNTCAFDLNQGDGTYNFQVKATADETVYSSVSTTLNTSGPGTPTAYSKEKTNSCTYKINFYTANDSGKTVRVVLYRSDETNFPLDSAHQVNEQNIGSNTAGSFTNDVSPNCDKPYYFAVRAFDSSNNPSGAVGDAGTTTINPTGVEPTTGAIPVGNGSGSVLGANSSDDKMTGEKDKNGEVMGAESKADDNSKMTQDPVNWIFGHKKISLTVLVLVLAGAYLALRYRKNKTS